MLIPLCGSHQLNHIQLVSIMRFAPVEPYPGWFHYAVRTGWTISWLFHADSS
jgi:hypothetical protein